jgi:hypothetical protein
LIEKLAPLISPRLLVDCEFPGNLEHLRNHPVLSEEVKEKILYKISKRFFNL